MFIRLSLLLVALTVLGCGSSPKSPSVPASPPAAGPDLERSYDFSGVDRILERIAPRHGGCALVVVHDGKVIYRKSFGGHAADKVVPIASASKWLSGALIMTLVDEGKIKLNDPDSKYLPDFGDDKATMTIRHLWSHTSGLPSETGCRNDKRTTLESCAARIARSRTTAAPGEQFFYAGVSMHAGGRVAEVVSGKSWNDLFVERIAAPLGMSKTDFFAYGPTGNPRPAGDARSSADEYAVFLQMLLQGGTLNGQRILSEASVAEMHKDQTGDARIEYTIYEKHRGLDQSLALARYGVGMWRERFDQATGELQEVSSQGALGFTPWIDVERRLGAVLSVKSSFSRVMPDYLELKNEIRRVVPVADRPAFR